MSDGHKITGSGIKPPSSGATSRSLLERVKANEAAAWDRLVGLYAPLVFQWCRRWNLHDEDTADILQEVFQSVVTHIEGFRKARPEDTFRGWLRTITRNKVRDHFRRRGREPNAIGGSAAQVRLAQFPDPDLAEEEDRGKDDDADWGLFHRALNLIRNEFEERTWQAFWRTAVEGQAPTDVGAELSMSPGAVRVAKSRVLRRLREELGDLAG
jgi:RNA polymerase sigma-70 factor (ECF subfamily)